jgi:hypothetical protein
MRLSLLLVWTLVVGACSSQSPTGNGTGPVTGNPSVCSGDPRGMTYAIGLSATGMKGLKATFVDATPAPPAKNENSWTLKITDGQGNPVNGATLAAAPFMPDHGHGPPALPIVTPMGSDGTYVVNQLDFFMAGIWQVTFTITPTSGPADSVVFTFCVDG